VLCGLIGFEPRHFQQVTERVETVAFGDPGKFPGERGYVASHSVRCFSVIRIVAVIIPIRHFLFTARFIGASF
jgi:hypothetical protein